MNVFGVRAVALCFVLATIIQWVRYLFSLQIIKVPARVILLLSTVSLLSKESCDCSK